MRRNWVDFRVLRREYFELRHIRKGGENDIYYLDRRTYRLTLEIFICKLKIWSTCIVQLLVKIIIKLNWVDAEKAWIQSALKAIRGCENDILFFQYEYSGRCHSLTSSYPSKAWLRRKVRRTSGAKGSRGITLQFSEVRAMRDIIMRFNTLVLAKWSDQAAGASSSATSWAERTKEAAANKKRKFVLRVHFQSKWDADNRMNRTETESDHNAI